MYISCLSFINLKCNLTLTQSILFYDLNINHIRVDIDIAINYSFNKQKENENNLCSEPTTKNHKGINNVNVVNHSNPEPNNHSHGHNSNIVDVATSILSLKGECHVKQAHNADNANSTNSKHGESYHKPKSSEEHNNSSTVNDDNGGTEESK